MRTLHPKAGHRQKRSYNKPHPVYVAPAVVIAAFFILCPSIEVARISLFRSELRSPALNFRNFGLVLGDPLFIEALSHSLAVAFITSVISVLIGTGLALALNNRPPLHNFMQSAIFLPVILPASAISLAWRSGLDPYFGWANGILGGIAPVLDRAWLGGSRSALSAVIIVCILQSSGLPMLIVLAALQRLPPGIIEASYVDGTNGWQRLRYVIVPLIWPSIVVTCLLQFVFGFYDFDHVFVMTNGGPGTQSEVLTTYIYHKAFISRELAVAAGATTIVLIALVPLCLLYWLIARLRQLDTEPTVEFESEVHAPLGVGSRRWRSWLFGTMPLFIWAAIALLPVLAVLSCSLRSTSDILSNPFGLPTGALFGNYQTAWGGPRLGQPIWRYFLNSGVAVGVAVTVAISVGAPAGYALATFGYRRLVGYFLLLAALPVFLCWIPLFNWASDTHTLSSPTALGIVYGGLQVPFAVLLLRSYFIRQTPLLVEAAYVDGATQWRAFLSVVLPTSRRPIILVCALMAVSLWNELGLAKILLVDGISQTLPVGISLFKGQYGTNLGAQYAALAIALVPVVIAYLIVQTYLSRVMPSRTPQLKMLR